MAARSSADDGVTDLFRHHGEQQRQRLAPLADRLRPRHLDDFAGQEAILGPGRLLRRAIAADRVGNLLLHGPPGVGKTTLARIIAGTTRAHFSSLNAVLAGIKDLRLEVEAARERLERHGLRTLLFIDEVHRFNTAQQDALLPWVENGTVTLIGATTENPYFEVNKALVSRSRLFRLQPLGDEHLRQLLHRALKDRERGYGDRLVHISEAAIRHLVSTAAGDARSLLNALELAVETTPPDAEGAITIDLAIAEESIQERAVLYDKQVDAHFDTISAFIKSLRGSDADAALFWLARMVEAGENPRFIFRRMLIAAGEDIGLADPQAIVVVEACAAAFERVGLPEGLYPLAQAALYLAGTDKSNSVLGFFDALRSVRESNRQSVPSHLRDSHRDGQGFGDGVGYRYPHAYAEHWVAQQYLPSALQGQVFWQPGPLGWEGQQRKRLQRRRAAQLAAAAESLLGDQEILTGSPEDPALERWLQRQAVAEGERLDQLRQRFWHQAGWQRQDRVLLLGGRSLLWALDPLQATPEGGVVIAAATDAARERCRAQITLLDSLRQPRLITVPPDQPWALTAALDAGERFEWIAARQPFAGLDHDGITAWSEVLASLVTPDTQLRLLFSEATLGPAAALLAGHAAALGADERRLLQAAIDLERPPTAPGSTASGPHAVIREGLTAAGWILEAESWNEALQLDLRDGLLERWLRSDGPYHRQVAASLGPERWQQLEGLLRRFRGQPLPQPLEHTLLRGRRCP
ncbi:MAG: AAA family ATPase [Cyanobacteriota bacterium]